MTSRTRKINVFPPLIFFIITTLYFPFQAFAKSPENTDSEQYQKLIDLYSECIKLEESNFSKLTFEVSSDQPVKAGTKLKLILLDNFGRPWMFKPRMFENNKEYRATVGYRIYKLFGLNSPETHVVRLKLNGKEVTGGIQRYIDNLPEQIDLAKGALSPNAVRFLMKAQVLDWLVRDYDTKFDNFLITSLDGGYIEELCRVDFELILEGGESDYNYDYMLYLPKKDWIKPEKTYYYWLMKKFESRDTEVDWKSNYSFVEFVADMPDNFLTSLVLPAKTGNFQAQGGPLGFGEAGVYWDPIVLIKKNLRVDFSRFYDRLEEKSRNQSEYSSSNKENEIDAAYANLNRWKKELKIDEAKIKNLSKRQTDIEARVSVEGYRILYETYFVYPRGGEGAELKFDQAWEQLSGLEDKATSELEKEAIRYYKQQMLKMRNMKFDKLMPTEVDASQIPAE